MPDYAATSIALYEKTGINFPVCGNTECSHFGDTTPTSGPHTHRCLMCNELHVTARQLQNWQERR